MIAQPNTLNGSRQKGSMFIGAPYIINNPCYVHVQLLQDVSQILEQ